MRREGKNALERLSDVPVKRNLGRGGLEPPLAAMPWGGVSQGCQLPWGGIDIKP